METNTNTRYMANIKNEQIGTEFGQLSGKEFFKPITERLENSTTPKEGSPDFVRTNPFV